MKEVEASLKYIKGSCYKLNNVANLIRKLSVNEAMAQLTFCEKRISRIVQKLLCSAIANAENNFKIKKEQLQVNRVECGKAFTLKRSMPRGRGRMTRVEKKYSNIKIVLGEISTSNGKYEKKSR